VPHCHPPPLAPASRPPPRAAPPRPLQAGQAEGGAGVSAGMQGTSTSMGHASWGSRTLCRQGRRQGPAQHAAQGQRSPRGGRTLCRQGRGQGPAQHATQGQGQRSPRSARALSMLARLARPALKQGAPS